MVSYKRDVLERQSLSEAKISKGWGSPICERVCNKIVEHFKNNIPQHQTAKALQISSSTVHKSSKDSENLEKSLCRCQLKLYHSKMKPYVNMVQKRLRVLWVEAYLKIFEVEKCSMVKRVKRVQILHSCWKDTVSSGLKRRETLQCVISVQFKSQHLWWYGGA